MAKKPQFQRDSKRTPERSAGGAAPPPKDDAGGAFGQGLEELEPRILLSTLTLQDPDALAGEVIEQQLSAEELARLATRDEQTADLTSAESAETARRELVFVDASVEDYDRLLLDLFGDADGTTRSVEVVMLDGGRDGLDQISEALAERDRLDAVHVIAHGSEGRVELGSSVLDASALDTRREEITAWGAALTDEADLLFYGCNFAGSAEGKELVSALAETTGADIAASDDLTGAAALGGDWDLEVRVGEIETASGVSAAGAAAWQGVLDITTGLQLHHTFESDGSDSSGNDYDGTLTNGASIDTNAGTNQVGTGKVSLDGFNDYVDLSAHVGNFQSLSEGTIAAWIRPDTNNHNVIFQAGDAGDSDSRLALIYDGSSNRINYYVNDGFTTHVRAVGESNDVPAGSWTHVAVTVDSGGTKLYVNGVQQSPTFTDGSAATQAFFADVTDLDFMAWGVDRYGGVVSST